jgi:predicted transposase/invertase (TIGR01784 family)
MDTQILSPRSDFIFKLIFGNQANADILAAFLRTVLKLPENEYETLTIVDPHLQRKTADGKMSSS